MIDVADKILSAPEVSELTGLSRTTIWRLERDGEFPQRRQISRQRVGHLCSEVLRWIEERPMARIRE